MGSTSCFLDGLFDSFNDQGLARVRKVGVSLFSLHVPRQQRFQGFEQIGSCGDKSVVCLPRT